jgi:hypothetical protein
MLKLTIRLHIPAGVMRLAVEQQGQTTVGDAQCLPFKANEMSC